ncbi:alanine racemase [Testudinibacter sp. TR-2022]|uniref:alanine racemase n=1 Tax=Testudinibacter sp. TR-2022 TaxID=2585029 RepID=UPI001119DB76|nr:alanine racemase [Testudinibacter sp. TR-2022]TNH05585.1 alanine racemase [Pasteurellaceae bacterium Phil31]TNH08112.1 alanine racemase [Testudinibacter sp. TR-2022]TNH09514.1 alanine racemase [Testudinibacter sp. TR-2022]TNH15375.1 alanine racemase [Testudinibacter sp. TR-2022]TNH17129.1 alanine racemase [Testudinibacter sp. TR-2022]
MKTATATISLSALQHNLQQVKRLAPNSRILAIVKANGYGHGMLQVAKAVQPYADGYGVARLAEALALRQQGIEKPILLLEGFFSADDLPHLLIHNIETVVHSKYQLQALEQVLEQTPESAVLDRKIKVWLKIDSGMHRLGVSLAEVDTFYQRLQRCPNVQPQINFVSHFSRAEELKCGYSEIQLQRFQQACADKEGERSLAASNGILYWQASHFDWVRPGIILYGISPTNDQLATEYGLQPAMTFSSSLIAVREHPAGEPVGYGGAWLSQKDTKIGVVALGYGDGYPRDVPAGTPVLINGKRVPIVGKVSMDMITVDLGADSRAQVGDEVIFWGKDSQHNVLPIEEVARHIGVISYELVTKLTPRVIMEYR